MKAFLIGWMTESGLALDQFVNAVFMPLLTWSVGFSDETLSARCWRLHEKPWARLLMPLIDWLFSWQASDPEIVDETGQPITGHCRRAYMKEKLRRGLPPEYRV